MQFLLKIKSVWRVGKRFITISADIFAVKTFSENIFQEALGGTLGIPTTPLESTRVTSWKTSAA